jgi:hypothetical protein
VRIDAAVGAVQNRKAVVSRLVDLDLNDIRPPFPVKRV